MLFANFLKHIVLHIALQKKYFSTRMGFEPTRAEHNGLAVHRLNHSATSSYTTISKVEIIIAQQVVFFFFLLSFYNCQMALNMYYVLCIIIVEQFYCCEILMFFALYKLFWVHEQFNIIQNI